MPEELSDLDLKPDSDFEVSVANVVTSLGYGAKPQLGGRGRVALYAALSYCDVDSIRNQWTNTRSVPHLL